MPGLAGPDASGADRNIPGPGDEAGQRDATAPESSTSDAPPVDGGLPSGDSGAAVDSASTTDSADSGDAQVGDSAHADAKMAGDASSDGSVLRCGPGLACSALTICCATNTNNPTYACTAESACTFGDTPVTCDNGSDCPSPDVCCGDKQATTSTKYTHVSCAATCPYPDVVFCDPTASKCVQGMTCQPSTILPGFYVCL